MLTINFIISIINSNAFLRIVKREDLLNMKMNMDEKYKVIFNGNEYYFDLMKISEKSAIAVFDALSDIKMANDACVDMIKTLESKQFTKDNFDTIVTAESKSVTMAAYIANHYGKDLVILRKKKRNFFKEIVEATVETFTTRGNSTLYLDVTHSSKYLRNKRVLIFDDVLSTGSSLKAMIEIMNKMDARVVGKAFIFNEGDDERESDVYYVHKLPIIEV